MSTADDEDSFHERSQRFHDMRKRNNWKYLYHDLYARIGNELAFSPGFLVDAWHYLSCEISVWLLMVLYFFLELLLVLVFGAILFALDGTYPAQFETCFLISMRHTLLANFEAHQFSFITSGDSIQIRAIGAAILLVEGFLHFIFVCVCSSLIIVRALRPLQQVTFAHHCVLTDEELVVRIRLLRPHNVVLIAPSINLEVCLTSGTFIPLKLVNGSYSKWSGNPTITVRHKITPSSPFYQELGPPESAPTWEESPPLPPEEQQPRKFTSTTDGIAVLNASIVASDEYGTPVTENQSYFPTSGFMDSQFQQYYDSENGEGYFGDVPCILHHCKYADQLQYTVPTAEQMTRSSSDRLLFGLVAHPHGPVSNIKLYNKQSPGQTGTSLFTVYMERFKVALGLTPTSNDEKDVQRLVTDSDMFARVVHKDSTVGKMSTSFSTAVAGAREVEDKHVKSV